jgi:hypothetical protein
MFEYFYNESIRKAIVVFGSLFNNIKIRQVNDEGEVFFQGKVPIAYAPTQKFLARLREVPDLNKPVQITLPRMSFEIIGLSYDPTRKLSTATSFCAKDINNNVLRKVGMPAPYNLNFELSIMTKHSDDMFQIIEQIIPYFQPNLKISATLLDSISEKKDLDIVLDNITMTDNFEGDFKERRALIYTLKFTIKTYIFGPISSGSLDSQIIKKVSIGLVAGELSTSPIRDVVSSSTPRAIQNYTGIVETTLTKEVSTNDIQIEVVDATNIVVNSYIDINGEEMLIDFKDQNKLKVKRGQDGTSAMVHVSGSNVKRITVADNSLIPYGDSFGFDSDIN